MQVLNDENVDPHRRDRMAELAAPYIHPRLQAISIQSNKPTGDLNVVQIVVQGVEPGKDFRGQAFDFAAPRLPPAAMATVIEALDEPQHDQTAPGEDDSSP